MSLRTAVQATARSWSTVASRHASTSAVAATTSTSQAAAPSSPPPTLPQSSSAASKPAAAPSSTRLPGNNKQPQSDLPTNPFEHHVPIKPRHGVHVATLHLRSHTTDLDRLTFFTSFALRAAKALGLPTSGAVALPTKTSLFTVPRSPFAHKKSQQNFWRKEHKRAIKVYDGTQDVVKAWFAYLRREAMGGVGQKAQAFEYKEVGWGRKMVQDQAELLRRQGAATASTSSVTLSSASTSSEQDSEAVKALAEQLQTGLEAEVKAEEDFKRERAQDEASAMKSEADRAQQAESKERAEQESKQ